MFSIIVPIYNVEPYLEKCVSSLRKQTWADIEIVLVDDESPDNCPAICDRLASEDQRVKVIHKKNAGLSEARNSGLKIATKDYIIFVDADDYIEYDACARFAKYAKKDVDIIIGEAVVHGGVCPLSHIAVSEKTYTGPGYLKTAHSEKKAPMAAWLNVYRRKFLEENNLFFKPAILHEDEQFTPRAFLKAKKVVNSGIEFYHYMLREGSITAQKDKRRNAANLYETCCELEQIYREVEDKVLRWLLLDSLAAKYLYMFQTGNLYRYGRSYLHTAFLWRNAKKMITRIKVLLITVSPELYCAINRAVKWLGR